MAVGVNRSTEPSQAINGAIIFGKVTQVYKKTIPENRQKKQIPASGAKKTLGALFNRIIKD